MAQSATISCRASNPMDSSGSHFSNLEQGRFTRSDGRCERLTTSKDYAFDCNSQTLMVEMFATLGAEPVILPYTRTKTALMTGLIDAAENNWPSYVASDHYSVAPYFALTEHTMTPDVLIMSMKAWRSLNPADQNIFRNAARDSSIFLRGQWKNWEASFRKQALDLGVTVIEIDRKPLEAALTGLYTKVLTDSHSSILSSPSKKTNKVSALVHSEAQDVGLAVRPRCSPAPTR